MVGVEADEGESGSNGLDDRRALARALAAVTEDPTTGKRRAEAVMVARLDRLSRDLVLQEQLLREAWGLDAEVLSAAEGERAWLTKDDPDDPSRSLVRQVLGAVAQYERSLVSLRLRAGRDRARVGGSTAASRSAVAGVTTARSCPTRRKRRRSRVLGSCATRLVAPGGRGDARRRGARSSGRGELASDDGAARGGRGPVSVSVEGGRCACGRETEYVVEVVTWRGVERRETCRAHVPGVGTRGLRRILPMAVVSGTTAA